ncbi:MAG: hypothetical protein H7Y04_05840 [Verrucomicrobia bacterium]|nr:hypothetical protein [Cytophagales bacterium]
MNTDLSGFKAFLKSKRGEKLFTLTDNRHFLSFDNVVEVTDNTVKLLYEPDEIVFRKD